MPNRLITLTTDFGTSDYFAGAMKGVIACIAPAARVIDITHEIAPYSILDGAFTIAQAATCYPKGTIHVVVVDPGVGSERRALVAESAGQFFIAPDNGVLTMVFRKSSKPPKVRVVTNPKLALVNVSRTFHGRDIFAPAAGHLARGVKPAQFGKQLVDYVRIENIEPIKLAPSRWRGTIIKADRFGNLITNFHIADLPAIKTNSFTMRAGRAQVRLLASTFYDVKRSDLAVIAGSSGFLEICANQASAAEKLGCSAGSPVELEVEVD